MTRNYGTYLKLQIIFQHTTAVVTERTIETFAQNITHSFLLNSHSNGQLFNIAFKTGYMHNIISIYRVQNLVWPDDNKRIHAQTCTPRRPHRKAWLCQDNTPQEHKCCENGKGKYRNVTIWLNGIIDNAKWQAVKDIKKKKKRRCETFAGFHVNIQFSLSLSSIVERFIWCTPCTLFMSVPWHWDCLINIVNPYVSILA